MEQMVKDNFDNRIFETAELEAMIKNMKKLQAQSDNTGRVTESGANRKKIDVGLGEEDRFNLEVMRIVMGDRQFNQLETNDDPHVKERMKETKFYKSWVNNGKPNNGRYSGLKHLFYDKFGGDLLINPRAYEAASTSSLTTVVKNALNVMTAADYSVRERWWEPLVTTEEVDTIDQATLARLYGASTLSVVDEGQAYTELALSDEEETASFVKKGNYVGITLETMLRDKVQFIRRIPRTLNNSWYNTLSSLVSGVFTVNSATGPALSDTGALFNATAATTAGGHANLLTTALSFSAYGAARNAMRDQTDQTLGTGRRLLISPKFLLVPIELETTGLQVRNSELIPGSPNNDVNPHYQQFEVVTVPDWTDANDWGLGRRPGSVPIHLSDFPEGTTYSTIVYSRFGYIRGNVHK
jgi:hypothetical protein